MTTPVDDRFERDLRAVVRASAPDAAPIELRDRLAATMTVVPVRPPRAFVGWPFVAAMGAAIVLAAILLRPEAPNLQGGRPPSGLPSGQTAVGSERPSAATTPDAEPMERPGDVQTGQLITATAGVVMNTSGRVLLTHDSGATWRDITPVDVASADFSRSFFLSPDIGWVVTLDPAFTSGLTVWRTVDAGRTWNATELPDVRSVNWQLGFVSRDVGWLASDPGGDAPKPELRWTTDGGATWSDPIDLAEATGRPTLDQITFLDRIHGVITGDNVFLATSDGGARWSAPNVSDTAFNVVDGTPHYGQVQAVSDATAFVVVDWLDSQGATRGQTVLQTFNGGADWVARYGDARHRFWDFVDEVNWVVTDGTMTSTTDDAGTSWGSGTSTGLPANLLVARLDFADPVHGWAEAAGGGCPAGGFGVCAGPAIVPLLYKTDDAGSSWSLVGDCGDAGIAPCPTIGPGSTISRGGFPSAATALAAP